MKMKKKPTLYIAQAAIIAALYIVLTYLLQPISFSGSQLRVSEALTILPAMTPAAIPALTIGCLLSNLASPFGMIDIVLGTTATLLAAICTYLTRKVKIKGLPVLSAIFPVIFNAIFVGASIAIMNEGGFTWGFFIVTALSVALGEAIACFVLGLPLFKILEKTKIFSDKEQK